MQLNSQLALALPAILAFATAGCSVTGALIGSQIDDATRENVNLPPDPHDTRILLRSEHAQASMPYALVEAVRLGHGSSARTIGMGIGALIDLGIVMWALTSEFERKWDRGWAEAFSKR